MRLQSQRQRVVLQDLLLRRRKRGGFAERIDLRQCGERWVAHLVPSGERRAVFCVHDGERMAPLPVGTVVPIRPLFVDWPVPRRNAFLSYISVGWENPT